VCGSFLDVAVRGAGEGAEKGAPFADRVNRSLHPIVRFRGGALPKPPVTKSILSGQPRCRLTAAVEEDRALLERLRAGDENAFEALVVRL
jgi:hypothetical protein